MKHLQNPHKFVNNFEENFCIDQWEPDDWCLLMKASLQKEADIEGEDLIPVIGLPKTLCEGLTEDQRSKLLTALVNALNAGYRIGHDQGQKCKAWEIRADLGLEGDVF